MSGHPLSTSDKPAAWLPGELTASLDVGAARICDALLFALVKSDANGLWLAPDASGDEVVYRATFEKLLEPVRSCIVHATVGEAAAARLALLAGLDLLTGGTQVGRVEVRAGTTTATVQVTMRMTETGLGAELLLADRQAETVSDGGNGTGEIEPGHRIGPYEVIKPLDAGGMGEVYIVRHVHLDKVLALKAIREEVLAEGAEAVATFLCEARAAARLEHPGIVKVYDFGQLPLSRRPYLVMELIDGESLREFFPGRVPFEPTHALMIAEFIGRALHAAHCGGVIHGDLTPANVFIGRNHEPSSVCLIDFGSATMRGAPEESPKDMVAGTPCYMSPEQIRGKSPVVGSDIYGLGIVLYEMLTGTVPFDHASIEPLLRMHLSKPPPALRLADAAATRLIAPIVARCLEKKPEQRYETAQDFVDACAEARDHLDNSGWKRWLLK